MYDGFQDARRAGKETAVNRWITTFVIGLTLAMVLPRAAEATLTLPDIGAALQSAPQSAFHLQLRTTHSAAGVVDGVNLDLGLTPPAITTGGGSLPVALDVALGRHDGRSHPRRAPRRGPSPSPRFHMNGWVPVVLVIALVIVITCPTAVVLYY
jgi:hypothetical protein